MERKLKNFYKKLISYLVFFNTVTFIKTSNSALCQQKEFVLNLKVVYAQMTPYDQSFSSHLLLGIFLLQSFSYALYSDDSS